MRNILALLLFSQSLFAQSSFDLRTHKLTTENKEQSWGTCWAFTSIASIESNILIERSWSSAGMVDLSEYHLDKFNGFNRDGHSSHKKNDFYSGQGKGYQGSNTDEPSKGLIVHLGGDFKMVAAYLSNIGGAVEETKTPTIDSTHSNHNQFGNLANEGVRYQNDYTYYLPKSVEWLTYGSTEENINRIKESIKKYGSVSSTQFMEEEPVSKTILGEEVHYYHGDKEPNHAVNIIGWDDEMVVIPFLPGVWKVQDSDHVDDVLGHIGYFLTPYADKYTGQHPEYGGVSYRGVKAREFSSIYSHALHGWQYEFKSEKVSNIYKLKKGEIPSHVGAYSVEADDRLMAIVTDLKGNMLCHTSNEKKGNPGFYLLELKCDPSVNKNKTLRVEIKAESGSYAYDATKAYKLLLNSSLPEQGEPLIVPSKSNSGESFYFKDKEWHDLNKYRWASEEQYGLEVNKTGTANFAINLYTSTLTP